MNKDSKNHIQKKEDTIAGLKAGIVTSIEVQTDVNRRSIFIDGDFAFGVSVFVLEKIPVRIGEKASVAVQKKLVEQDFQVRARGIAINYLSYKPRTRRELETRLKRFAGDSQVVDSLIAEFSRSGLINDLNYANAFISSRYRVKGHGPSRLRSDLIRKGVARDTIDEALQQLGEDDFEQRAEELLRRQWHKYRKLTDNRVRKRRAVAFLQRSGYPVSLALEVFNSVGNETSGNSQ